MDISQLREQYKAQRPSSQGLEALKGPVTCAQAHGLLAQRFNASCCNPGAHVEVWLVVPVRNIPQDMGGMPS